MDRPDNNRSGTSGGETSGLPLWKRMLDLALLVLVSPALLVLGGGVALLVACGSRGPLFFRQARVGYKGREFMCYKFRTMKVNAEAQLHRDYFEKLMDSEVPMTKLDARSDPRVVPFGALLRATGMDELPQVFNIVRGEMSFVGPRPCIPYEYERYKPSQQQRFDVVPGLTGLWQVSGKNRTTFSEMIQLDIEYSKRQSLGLDLWIILKTLPALWQQYRDLRERKRHQVTAPPSAGMGKSVEYYRL